MILDISNDQQKYEFTSEMESLIHNCIVSTIEAEKLDTPVEVSIVLTDNEGIRKLNYNYRGKDIPTDVLSFPLIECTKDLVLSEGDEAIALGDIIISLEKAHSQSIEYNHDFLTELGFLIVHGMLHLLGYDHETDADNEKLMHKKEKHIMEGLGLIREDWTDEFR